MPARCLRSVTISELPKVARMVGYPMRRRLRGPPSPDQRKFLETLRDLGPRNNAETLAVRRSTKRACQVRGWVEWRCLEDPSDVKAWHSRSPVRRRHLTIRYRLDRPMPVAYSSLHSGETAMIG